nr:hypothetical protein [Tanacetum cinerariifolium]GFD14958.1 hypothetical protein [Tanacetum cinerariifolium]
YPTSEGDNDADDNGDDFLEDDADNDDEEESSDTRVFLRQTYRFRRELVSLLLLVDMRGKSSVAARQIRPTLTIAESRRADGKLIGRLRRERRYFRTVATHYVQEVAHSRDYCARIMDYCQSREVHTSTLVT